ncbi:MAG: TlpA disulfide reductase family protein [bacterium]|nr:TlpA disulfide reductase family protein [bacterium]
MSYVKVCIAALLLWAGQAGAGTAPDFSLPDLKGKRVNLQKLLEKGPVLVDFWATYCKPCLKAMPKFAEMHRKYEERGLTILGVNEDGPRGQAKVRPFLKRLKIPYRTVIDGDGSLLRRFKAPGCPSAFLIAPDGEIVLKQAGYIPRYHKEMIDAIEMLLPKDKADHTSGGDHAEK